MPQLIPFYFTNEVTYTFLTLIVLIYLLSKFILPRILRLFTTRIFITKL